MEKIQYHIVSPAENDRIRQIADWYFSEWKIPILETVQRLTSITADPLQCQVLLTVNGLPVATGGLYSHIGLIDKVPGFNVYRNWLALFTQSPANAKKGMALWFANTLKHMHRRWVLKKYTCSQTQQSTCTGDWGGRSCSDCLWEQETLL